jgi:glycosyltransferase involved in cell wall biosynthesis
VSELGAGTQHQLGPDQAPPDRYGPAYFHRYGPRDASGHPLAPPYRRGEAHWKEFFARIAQRIVQDLHPGEVLDAGCAIGLLVEELHGLGVKAQGIDVSQWAIGQVPAHLRPFCRVASLSEELEQDFDLVVCLEVLEHLPAFEAHRAVANLSRHARAVLFSSTPEDFEEPTHLNVQPSDYWVGLFAQHGLFRDFLYDASFVAPHALLLRRRDWGVAEVAREYERAWWQARQLADGMRRTCEAEREAVVRAEQAAAQAGAERDRLQARLALAEDRCESLAASLEDSRRRAERLQAQADEATQLLEERSAELEAVYGTKTFRYLGPLRRAYRALFRRPARPEAAQAPRPARQSERSYEEWVAAYDSLDDACRRRIRDRVAQLAHPPLISVLMPVYDPPITYLRAAVESVLSQLYPHFELCIADDASSDPVVRGVLDEFASQDPRVKVVHRPTNGHVSAATNSALELATGDYVAFLDHDDTIAEHALAAMAVAICETPDAGLLYSDEDKLDTDGRRSTPYFKPDWDPLLLLSQNYACHLCVIRRDLVEEVGGLREGYEGAQDWDLILRVTERLRPEQIVHLPHVLYHWRRHPGSTTLGQSVKPYAAGAATRAIEDHLRRRQTPGAVRELGRLGLQSVRWELPAQLPLVSIVVPTKDSELALRCLESVVSHTTYPSYEVLVVDNGARDTEAIERLAGSDLPIRLLRDDRPFNFSALNNRAVGQARGEVVCLLNDDTEVLTGDWLEEMVAQLAQPGVGVVGAKLYYPDGRLQHVGVVLGLGGGEGPGIAGHVFVGADRNFYGYSGNTVVPRRPSAVTAACMCTRRQVWDELGGLDEDNLAVSFNDVDYCLRARAAGWAVVWTPWAGLIHHESVSRGDDFAPDNLPRSRRETRFMLERWGDLLQNDPAYNPNLTLETPDYGLAWPPRRRPWWA